MCAFYLFLSLCLDYVFLPLLVYIGGRILKEACPFVCGRVGDFDEEVDRRNR